MHNKKKNLINLAIGIGLAALLLWLFFKDADWSSIASDWQSGPGAEGERAGESEG